MKRLTPVHRLVQWVALGTLVGGAAGVASAAFLYLLDVATRTRESHLTLVYFLPLAGLALGFIFERWGRSVTGGSNLVIDSVHEDSPKIPLRMAPMILVATVATHLFGGSAGREGAAVQMGAALADDISHRLHLSRHMRVQLLAAGIAGGFGSVFGTPIAGALFGLEVIALGRIEYSALLPALIAALVGDAVTRGLGITHAAFPTVGHLALTPVVFLKLVVLAIAVSLLSRLFTEATHRLKTGATRVLPSLPLRMAVGGIIIVVLWRLSGTSDFLGLGTATIARAFTDASLPWTYPLLKLLFTVVTLGFGFLGGEVTPLFFIGATLGTVVGGALGLPLPLSAGIGLAAMFGSASNTPLALSVMAIELFGAAVLPHVVIVSVLAYLLTGHRSIYPTQRVGVGKYGRRPLEDRRLCDPPVSAP